MRKKIVLILLLIIALCVQGAVSREKYRKKQKSIFIKAGKPRKIKGKLADSILQLVHSKQRRILQSSSLHPEKYNASRIFDQNFSTCWAEGSRGFGRGDWVIFRSIAIFWIYNGMWRSKDLFYANNRVKKMKISFYNVYARSRDVYDSTARKYTKTETTVFTNVYLLSETLVQLPDGMYPIEILTGTPPIPFEISPDNKELAYEKWANDGYRFCRLEILDVYPGTKYNDACISEIVFGTFDPNLPEFGAKDKYVY